MTVPLWDAAARCFVDTGVQHVCCEVLCGIIYGCLKSWRFRGTNDLHFVVFSSVGDGYGPD